MNLNETLRMSTALIRVLASYEMWKLRTRPRNTAGRVDVNDISVFFRRYGSGYPVVMLHGGFMFAETWAGQFPALSRHHQVFAIDARGHGRTSLGTRTLTYRLMAEDTAGFIERLGLGPVNLVGWSDGGCTSIGIALERPDLVRSMVLLGTSYNIDNYAEETKRLISEFLQPGSSDMMGARLIRRLMTPEPRRWDEFAGQMRRMWTELPDYTEGELSRIDAPTLVVACDRDEFFSFGEDPLRVFKETAEDIPGARMEVIEGGTHTVNMERPDRVNRLILDFLNDS